MKSKHSQAMRALMASASISLATLAQDSYGGAFIFAGEVNGIDIITHPQGYTGTGGVVQVNVCIDPTSANANDMALPLQNIIRTFNRQTPEIPNLSLGANNNIPLSSNYDFESVALHEVGHCIGLAHVNAATESGLSGSDREYTKATDGANNTFDINSGVDGVIGSSDDIRGDDVNLHWFQIANNDPFDIAPVGTIDNTTYSRNVANLPAGHNFAANASRDVSTLLGYGNSEAVMQQGSFNDEAQRTLVGDDVATLELAMAGLDETAGTSDDYAIELLYGGISSSGCDITLDFDNTQTGFAVCQTGGSFINGTHVRITSASIYFNTGFDWFFNDISNANDQIGVYRPAQRKFILDFDGNRAWSPGVDIIHVFGAVGDTPIIGDWDGDGDDDIGTYRPAERKFILDMDDNGSWSPGVDVVEVFGAVGDLPIIGDWNGDGDDDIGTYRPAQRKFILDIDESGSWSPGVDIVDVYGAVGDSPIIGDWNGDGDDDIGVYRPAQRKFILDFDENRSWSPGVDIIHVFGAVGDTPIIGDWNGDGDDDIGTYRPSQRKFILDIDESGSWSPGVDIVDVYGTTGDQPLVGKW